MMIGNDLKTNIPIKLKLLKKKSYEHDGIKKPNQNKLIGL